MLSLIVLSVVLPQSSTAVLVSGNEAQFLKDFMNRAMSHPLFRSGAVNLNWEGLRRDERSDGSVIFRFPSGSAVVQKTAFHLRQLSIDERRLRPSWFRTEGSVSLKPQEAREIALFTLEPFLRSPYRPQIQISDEKSFRFAIGFRAGKYLLDQPVFGSITIDRWSGLPLQVTPVLTRLLPLNPTKSTETISAEEAHLTAMEAHALTRPLLAGRIRSSEWVVADPAGLEAHYVSGSVPREKWDSDEAWLFYRVELEGRTRDSLWERHTVFVDATTKQPVAVRVDDFSYMKTLLSGPSTVTPDSELPWVQPGVLEPTLATHLIVGERQLPVTRVVRETSGTATGAHRVGYATLSNGLILQVKFYPDDRLFEYDGKTYSLAMSSTAPAMTRASRPLPLVNPWLGKRG